jgi:hypothetical protein
VRLKIESGDEAETSVITMIIEYLLLAKHF